MLHLVRGALPALHQLAGLKLISAAATRDYSTQLALKHVSVNKAGPGGRSSVSGITATVFGPNGFIGSYIVNDLGKRGSVVVCPYRSVETEVMHLKQMGDLGQIICTGDFDIRDDTAIQKAIARSNVVINCVGIRTETKNWSFEDVHVDFPQRLAKIVASAGHVDRLIHISDMGAAEDHPSRRMSTKAQGDKLVLQNFPDATILRPGPVVGIEDHFYNYLIYQLSFGIFTPVIAGGRNKIQPTFVLDLSEAVVNALKTPDAVGKTFYLGGPEVLNMRQLYDVLIKTMRLKSDDTVDMPAWLAKLMYKPYDLLRRRMPPLPFDSYLSSADYVEEQLYDKVVPKGSLGYTDLNVLPQKVTDGLPIEPVRHSRVGGYRWGDMANVANAVPESIRKYYNIK